jgi:hypothetical protein
MNNEAITLDTKIGMAGVTLHYLKFLTLFLPRPVPELAMLFV